MRFDPWPDESDPGRLRRMADAYRACGEAMSGRQAEMEYCDVRAKLADQKADEIEEWRATGGRR